MLPPGVTCPDWTLKEEGSKRCLYFLTGGACELPTHLMCVEWLKVNAHLVASSPVVVPEPPSALAALVTPAQAAPPPPAPYVPGAPLQLAPYEAPPPRKPSKAKAVAMAAHRAALGDALADTLVPAEPYDLPPSVTDAEVASLSAIVEEVHLHAELGDLVMVRHYSDAPRQEISFRDAATLRNIVEVFPGARVVKITKPVAIDVDAIARAGWASPVRERRCSVCWKVQFMSPGGITCPLGHGGADSIAEGEAAVASPQSAVRGPIEVDYAGSSNGKVVHPEPDPFEDLTPESELDLAEADPDPFS
jgi:hypothetical protein